MSSNNTRSKLKTTKPNRHKHLKNFNQIIKNIILQILSKTQKHKGLIQFELTLSKSDFKN